MKRRDLLAATAGVLLGAACTAKNTARSSSSASSASSSTELGPTTRAVTTSTTRAMSVPVDTIVVLMLENRSFDHHFGHLPGVDGIGSMGRTNPDPVTGEAVASFHMTDACTESDPDHSFDGSHAQWNNGALDGFVAASGPLAMGYRLPEDVSYTSAIASEFTVCDRWFCSVLGPTFPNRHYLHSGTSDGRRSNLIESFRKPSIWDRLTAAKIPWGYYYSDLPFLALYPDTLRAGTDERRITGVDRYFEDAEAGRLPNVTVVEPRFEGERPNDDHPPDSSVLAQRFVADVFGALASSPQWERSVFVLIYDEHGGFYDHVPPPATVDDHGALGFDHFGFRIPALIASPWARRRHVAANVFEHTSVLRFIEWRFGLDPLTVRDARAGNVADVLDWSRMDPRIGKWAVPKIDAATSRLCAAAQQIRSGTSRHAQGRGGDGMPLLAEITPHGLLLDL